MFDEVASFVSRTHLGFIHHESAVYSKAITSSAAENGGKTVPKQVQKLPKKSKSANMENFYTVG